ncbi:MAG: RtcB family protein [Eubacterium sp.]|nr:RtcB family protein [Eubacterium sp.]
MFVNFENTKYPIKIWLENINKIEDSCLEQAQHLANLPFIHKWVALMPDTHTGRGMPIGGVIATKGVIVPNAVGVDIGCGMNFIDTDIDVADVKEVMTGNGTGVQAIVGSFMRNIPVNTARHKEPQECKTIDNAMKELDKYHSELELMPLLADGYFQVGTLGGGNHFVELQEDDKGKLCIMIHSGSRHLGKAICDYFTKEAARLNEMYYSSVPAEYKLPFLPVDSKEGKQYINWMKLAMDYAFENRARMMEVAKSSVEEVVNKYLDRSVTFGQEINCHHNYAALENHFGQNVWVHRKGANRARVGDLAVIPGAMGSYSYVVEGLGNPDSFTSSSHGAGRAYSRSGAMNAFTTEEVMRDLKEQGVILGKAKKNDVAEECRFAYKNIDEVMEQQSDLVRPIRRMKTIGVLKG